jgi:hypothetical protein
VIREMGALLRLLWVYLDIEARMYYGSVCALALVALGPIQALRSVQRNQVPPVDIVMLQALRHYRTRIHLRT